MEFFVSSGDFPSLMPIPVGDRTCVCMSEQGCVNLVTSTGLFPELTLEELVFLCHEYNSIFLLQNNNGILIQSLRHKAVRRIVPEKVSFESSHL